MTNQGKMKLQVWLLITVVFLLGGVTGASIDRLYWQKNSRVGQGGPGGGRQRMIEDMRRDLSLTDEQVKAIRNIFEESRKEFPYKRIAECPSFKEMRERTRTRIHEVLTPEQRQKYDENEARREAERSEKR